MSDARLCDSDMFQREETGKIALHVLRALAHFVNV